MTDLSVLVVSYNVRDRLATCLLSLEDAREGLEVEVIVADNASSDGTAEMVRRRFPHVTLIETGDNLGFARANNLAAARASGRHLMLLNPDTILREDSLRALVRHLDAHPEAGAAGPKVLDPDGSFQATSKRGLPTPWVSFARLSGLSRLFPRSPVFNRYELGHLDPDEEHEVEVLYGAAMVVRREAWEEVGGLDEGYFMYGEDIALSDAVRRRGWRLDYVPGAPIVHVKGESTRRSDIDRDRHFYHAMRRFSRERFSFRGPKKWMVEGGIALALAISRARHWVRGRTDKAIDVAIVTAVALALGALLPDGLWTDPGGALALALLGVAGMAAARAYRLRARFSGRAIVASALVFLLLGLLAYFVRPSQGGLWTDALACAMGWFGVTMRRIATVPPKHRGRSRRLVIAGVDELSRAWLESLPTDLPGDRLRPVGWLAQQRSETGTVIEGLPVLGTLDQAREVTRTRKVRAMMISTASFSRERAFSVLEEAPLKGVRVELLDESRLWSEMKAVPEAGSSAVQRKDEDHA